LCGGLHRAEQFFPRRVFQQVAGGVADFDQALDRVRNGAARYRAL
jgi:hypothetical protein